jgi:hypothetical protein
MVGSNRVVARWVRLSVLSTLLFPGSALAQETVLAAGLHVGFTFERPTQVDWGITLLATHVPEARSYCSRQERVGYGGWFRAGMIGASSPRLGLGGHLGYQTQGAPLAAVGELGPLLGFKDGPRLGIHSAELFQYANANLYLRQQWLLADYSAGLEFRSQPTLGGFRECPGDNVVVGRPLRTSAGRMVVATGSCAARRRMSTTPSERAARRWERDAQMECASVGAFLALARDLTVAGAPEELVERALDAAGDEMVHAALCSEVARSLSGLASWPTLPPVDRPPPRDRAAALSRLAHESFADGCLNEGAAASIAAAAAHCARDPLARAAQQRIATDEARHAELAWDVLAWTAEQGGARLREELRRTCVRTSAPPPLEQEEELGDYGQLATDERAYHASVELELARHRAALLLERC